MEGRGLGRGEEGLGGERKVGEMWFRVERKEKVLSCQMTSRFRHGWRST